MNEGKDPEEKRRDFISKYDNLVIRLEDELEAMIKLAAMQREALKNEMFSGMAYKQQAADAKGIKALKDLTAAYNSLTDSKVRLDKTAKERAAKMTPDEEREAVVTYIKSLPATERTQLLRRLSGWHNAQATANHQMKVDIAGDDGTQA